MLEKIIDAKDRKFADIEALKKSERPLVMYGAGSYAVDVSKFLSRQGIEINEYCIDGEYLKDNQTIEGKTISSIEDAFAKHDSMDVVIGFSDYVKAREKLAALGTKGEIYFIDAPNQFGFIDYDFIVRNQNEFQKTYDMLGDEKSREIFIAFLNAKLSGDPSPLYPFAEFDQYFNKTSNLGSNEVFVDCGAFDGDSIIAFSKHVEGKYDRIYAFEPNSKNQEMLLNNIAIEGIDRVELVKKGSWSGPDTLRFAADANMSSATESGDVVVEVDSIDNVVGDNKVTYIKMDIEGAELESLKGAQKTIKNQLPKLAICVYHKPEDLIEIPQYISSLTDGYSYYLRHHQHMSWEMVLYAIPNTEKKQ